MKIDKLSLRPIIGIIFIAIIYIVICFTEDNENKNKIIRNTNIENIVVNNTINPENNISKELNSSSIQVVVY